MASLLRSPPESTFTFLSDASYVACCRLVYGFEYGHVVIQQLCLVLGIVADLDVMAYFQISRVGDLAHDAFDER